MRRDEWLELRRDPSAAGGGDAGDDVGRGESSQRLCAGGGEAGDNPGRGGSSQRLCAGAGVARHDASAHAAVRRELNASLRCWLSAAVVCGPAVLAALLAKEGRPAVAVTPRQAGAWLGCAAGCAAHSVALQPVSHLLPGAWRLAWSYYHVAVLYASVGGFFYLRRRTETVVDPGPPFHVYGIRHSGDLGLCSLRLRLTDAPPHGTVPRGGAPHSAEHVASALTRFHQERSRVAVMLLVAVCLATLVVELWSRQAARWAPLLQLPSMIGIFAWLHARVCRQADRYLERVNKEPELLRRNLAWVLRRTRLTMLYSLWLVRRDPYAAWVCADSWQRLLPHYAPALRRRMKVLLFATGPSAPEAVQLPRDVALSVLPFLAVSDAGGRRHTIRCRKGAII